MKLLVCIIDNFYADEVEARLRKKEYRMTKMASTGGFRRKGNTTFLFGVEEVDLVNLSEELKETCMNVEKKKQRTNKQTFRYTSFLFPLNDANSFIDL